MVGGHRPLILLQSGWVEHKKVHKDDWQFCTDRGRGRSSKMPKANWSGSLRPAPISPRRDVSHMLSL